MISFPSIVRTPIRNFKTGAAYTLVRGDFITPTNERLSEIVSICNEPDIYGWLFRDILAGQPYPQQKALDWVRWLADGWTTNSHFGFVVLAHDGSLAASCAIKGAAIHGSEVGYWTSAKHTGIMTSTLTEVIRLARAAGFSSLTCKARTANHRSKAVMIRAGFVHQETRQGETEDYFSIQI